MTRRRRLLAGTLAGAAVVLTGNGKAATLAESVPAPAAALFAVEFTTGPQWDAAKSPGDQLHFADHSANLRRLREVGMLLFGARYGEKGLVVLTAIDESAARSEIDIDPSIRTGVFRYELFPMHAFFPGCIGKTG